MKKRIFAMALALVMVLSLVPVVATAEPAAVTASPKAGTHTDAGHSDDCGLTDRWTAWDKADSLPTSGQYYLTKDVTLTGETQISGDLTLCLNGFVIKTTGNKRVLSTKDGSGVTFTVTDCTAYTENDVYYAGAITGGKDASAGGGAVFVRRSTTMKLYDGRLTQNTSTIAGGGVALQASGSGHAGAKMYMYGGEISDNTAIDGTKYKTGGAVYLGSGCVFEMTGGTLSGNKGSGGGAIYATGTNTVTLKNATVTGNTASYTGAALHFANATTLTVQDSDLSGNTCTNATAGGTIRMDGAGGKVILSGKTVIAGNTLATGKGDIMLMNTGTNKLTVDGLTAGSNVRFCAPNTTVTAAGDVITATAKQTDWDSSWVTFVGAEEQRVSYNGSEFSFATGHFHGTSEFIAWDKTDSLPATGSYYLTQDVTLSKQITLSGELSLCLNGHTVTGYKGRAYDVTATGKLNLYSCGKAGVFTGFSHSAHGGVFQSAGTVYAENITFQNNTTTNYGGAFLSTGGTATFKDCTFHKNTAAQGAAVSVAGTTTLTGCSFTENTATASGTLRAVGTKPILVENCTFTGNTAKVATAIQTAGSSILTLKDVTVTGNTNTNGFGAVNATGSVKPIVLRGKVIITGNTTNGKPQNLHLQNGTTDGYDVSGLTAGSSIGISLEGARITAGRMHFSTANASNNPGYFVSDSDAYEPVLGKDNKLTLQIPVPPITHIHCICGKTANPHCDHTNVDFTDWTDPSSLPTEGTWCLTVDVTVPKQFGVSKELTLCLNGHSITVSQQAGRAYYCAAGAKLSITDCAKTPGTISGATNTAILFNASSTDTELNLWNGIFTDNHIVGAAGAISIQGETVFNMYGGKITGNSATSAFKLDVNGDPILDADGNPTYYSSNGGGLYTGTGTTFNMYGGEISGNTSTHLEFTKKGATSVTKVGGYGGGAALYGSSNLYGGKVTGNTGFLGGGLFTSGSTTVMNLMGTEVSGNRATSAGGILNQGQSTVVLSAGSVTGNTATLSGGGLYVSINSKFHMTGGTVSDNSAVNNGGGIYMQQAQGTVKGGTVTGNKSSNLGGGFYLTNKGVELTVDDCLITKNEALSGAGIFAYDDSVLTVNGGKITSNKSNSAGGGISAFTNVVLTINGGSITNNTSKNDGGGLYLLRTNTTFKNATISGNTGANGGGIKITGGKVTFSGTTISGNQAVGKMVTSSTTGQPVQVPGSGGGINISQAGYKENGVQLYDQPVVTVNSFYLANNKATSAAGGILVQSKGSRFTMYGGTVTGNDATAGGGGLYFSTDTVCKIQGGTVSGNTSLKAGGIFILNALVDLSNVKVTGNTAGSIGGGFVIMGKTTVVNMKNMEITGNSSDATGGVAVIQNYATVNVEDSVIGSNSAKTTGGLYFSNPTYGNFKNTEIFENTSETAGGAIYTSSNCVVALDNCTVRDNSSESSGGGIYNKGRVELTNSKVLNNRSGKNGGGIGGNQSGSALLSDKSGIYATNTVISGNQAAEQGGGVFNHRGNPVYLEGCTLTDNTSGMEGSAVYADGRLGLTDTTVTGNNGTYAVYVMNSNYDGHSYTSGHRWLSGNVVILDNQGGNMYMQEGAIMAVLGEGLGEDAHVEIVLEKGYLTKQLQGVYHYELADGIYTVTAGDRSITDPEVYAVEEAPQKTQQTQAPDSTNTVLYIAIGVIALAVIAAAVLFIRKKKSPQGATKE